MGKAPCQMLKTSIISCTVSSWYTPVQYVCPFFFWVSKLRWFKCIYHKAPSKNPQGKKGSITWLLFSAKYSSVRQCAASFSFTVSCKCGSLDYTIASRKRCGSHEHYLKLTLWHWDTYWWASEHDFTFYHLKNFNCGNKSQYVAL